MAQKFGHSKFDARGLYALNLRHYKIPTDAFKDITGNFIACLAVDGNKATDEEIMTIAYDLKQ